MASIASRIQEGMEMRNLRQVDIVERTGINKGALSSYISGRYKPKQTNIYLIAKALDVNEAWLMGLDVPPDRVLNQTSNVSLPAYPNIHPVTKRTLPVLGEVACGEPRFMNEEIEFYADELEGIHADYVLVAHGDSMIGARIHDGDLVFVKKQEEVENGEIAVVAINDEATLKRVFYYRERELMILKAENSAYEDMIYQGTELADVHVLGKAVAFQGKLI